MKAITILEPWASLIACGEKKIETRSWATKYRGKIAIHAAAKHTRLQFKEPYYSVLSEYYRLHVPYEDDEILYGKIIAIADLVDCAQFTHTMIPRRNTILLNGQEVTEKEIAFGEYTPGRWGWILEKVQRIKPVPAKGQQRIWNWNIPDDYFIENFFQGVK